MTISHENDAEILSEDAEATRARKTRTSFTAEELARLGVLYETGDYTLAELGDMFDRDPSLLARKLKEQKVKKGSTAKRQKEQLQAELEKDMQKNRQLKVTRANETKEDHYNYARDVSKVIFNEVASAVKESRDPKNPDAFAFAKRKSNFQALKSALDGLAAGQGQRNIALGLDKGDIMDEDEIPELGIFEMTAEEIEDVKSEASKSMLDDDALFDADNETEEEEPDYDDVDKFLQSHEDYERKYGAGNDA